MSEPVITKVVEEGEIRTSAFVDEISSAKDESEFLYKMPQSYRRYMTPQLTAELSQFSGLSLRLEDGQANKEDKFANFPLRHGKPFVIGVIAG